MAGTTKWLCLSATLEVLQNCRWCKCACCCSSHRTQNQKKTSKRRSCVAWKIETTLKHIHIRCLSTSECSCCLEMDVGVEDIDEDETDWNSICSDFVQPPHVGKKTTQMTPHDGSIFLCLHCMLSVVNNKCVMLYSVCKQCLPTLFGYCTTPWSWLCSIALMLHKSHWTKACCVGESFVKSPDSRFEH